MSRAPAGSKSLLKSLSLLELVATGVHDLDSLAAASGLPRSTAHRLLSALAKRRYLRHASGAGYQLGSALIELGFAAQRQLHVTSVARPYMERLARASSETVHLGVLDGRDVVYIDKVPGTRGLSLASTIGARMPAQTTALGKALVAGTPPATWSSYFDPDVRRTERTIVDEAEFLTAVGRCRTRGYAEDREENEAGVRCIGVPIHDAAGGVVAALSVSGASLYMTDERVDELIPMVLEAGAAISNELGWRGTEPAARRAAEGSAR
jgi:DNA-binding IclR family transcriptional regulator